LRERDDVKIVTSIRDAKAHLANLVDQVARGQSVTITRRGVPVARLVPIESGAPLSLVEALEAEGLYADAPEGPDVVLPPPVAMRRGAVATSQLMAEMQR
jgi:prevent-host-death family protein